MHRFDKFQRFVGCVVGCVFDIFKRIFKSVFDGIQRIPLVFMLVL